MYQALHGRRWQQMEELSLGRSKGGRARWIEVYFPILLYNYFGTLITDRLIEGGRFIGDRLMGVRL